MKSIAYKILLGGLLLTTFIVLFAPARLLSNAVASATDNALLLQPKGSLWNGEARLLINKNAIGQLRWQFSPGALLRRQLAFRLQLFGDNFNLAGVAAVGYEAFAFTQVQGVIEAPALQRALAIYDIAPTGTLVLDELHLSNIRLEDNTALTAVTASGNAHWTGGAVNYRLAGRSNDIVLPPLTAVIATPNEWPEMLVTAQDNAMPLITGRITPRGSIAIGITRGFTRLAGQPWPGSEPDHAVVLEVEEYLI